MRRFLAVLSIVGVCCLGLVSPGVTWAKPNLKIVGLAASQHELGVKLNSGEWWIYGTESVPDGYPTHGMWGIENAYTEEDGKFLKIPALGSLHFSAKSPIGNIGVSGGSVYCTTLPSLRSIYEGYYKPEGGNPVYPELDTTVCPKDQWGRVSELDGKNIKYVASTPDGAFYAASDTDVWAWGHNVYGTLGVRIEDGFPDNAPFRSRLHQILPANSKKYTQVVTSDGMDNCTTLVTDKFESISTCLQQSKHPDASKQSLREYVGIPQENRYTPEGAFYFTNRGGKLLLNRTDETRTGDFRFLTGLEGDLDWFDINHGDKTIEDGMQVYGLPDTTRLEQLYFSPTTALAVINGETWIWGAQHYKAYDKNSPSEKNNRVYANPTPDGLERCNHYNTGGNDSNKICDFVRAPESLSNWLGGGVKPVPGSVKIRDSHPIGRDEIRFIGTDGYEYILDPVNGRQRQAIGGVVKPVKQIGTYAPNLITYGLYQDGNGFIWKKEKGLKNVGRPSGKTLKHVSGNGVYTCTDGSAYRFFDLNTSWTPIDYVKPAQAAWIELYFASYANNMGVYLRKDGGAYFVPDMSYGYAPDFVGAFVRGDAATVIRPRRMTPPGGFPTKFFPNTQLHLNSNVTRNDGLEFEIRAPSEYNNWFTPGWKTIFDRDIVGHLTVNPQTRLIITAKENGETLGGVNTTASFKETYSGDAQVYENTHVENRIRANGGWNTQNTVTVTVKVTQEHDECGTDSQCFKTFKFGAPKITVGEVPAAGDSGYSKVEFTVESRDKDAKLYGKRVEAVLGDNISSVYGSGGLSWDSKEKVWENYSDSLDTGGDAARLNAGVTLVDPSKPGTIQLITSGVLHRFEKPKPKSGEKLGACPAGVDWCQTVTIPAKQSEVKDLQLSLAPVSVEADGTLVLRLSAKNTTKFTVPAFSMRGGDDLSVSINQEGNTSQSGLPGTVWIPEVPGGETNTVDFKARLKPDAGEETPQWRDVRLHKIDGQNVDKKITVETRVYTPKIEILPTGDVTRPAWKITVSNPSGVGKLSVEGKDIQFEGGSQSWTPTTEKNTVILSAPAGVGEVTVPVKVLEPWLVDTMEAKIVDGSTVTSTVAPVGVSRDGLAVFKVVAENTSGVLSPGRTFKPSMEGYGGNPVFLDVSKLTPKPEPSPGNSGSTPESGSGGTPDPGKTDSETGGGSTGGGTPNPDPTGTATPLVSSGTTPDPGGTTPPNPGGAPEPGGTVTPPAPAPPVIDAATVGSIDMKGKSMSEWVTGAIPTGQTQVAYILVERGKQDGPIDATLTLTPQGAQCGGDTPSPECGILHIGGVQVGLSAPDTLPAPGTEAEWTLTLSNTSQTGDATHIKAQSLDAGSGLDNPMFQAQEGVTVAKDGKSFTLERIPAGGVTNIKIKAKVKPGVNLQDGVTHSVQVESLLSKPVTGTGTKKDESQLQVDIAASDTPGVWTATVKNPSKQPVVGVKVAFTVGDGITGLTVDGKPGESWDVGDLQPGESASVKLAGTRTEGKKDYTIQAKATSTLLPTLEGCKPNEGLDADGDRCDVYTLPEPGKTLILVTPREGAKAGDKAVFDVTVKAPDTGTTGLVISTDIGEWGTKTAAGTIVGKQWKIGTLKAGQETKNTLTVETKPDDEQVSVKVGVAPEAGCVANGDLSGDTDQCDTKTLKLLNGANLVVSTKLTKGDKAKAGQIVEWQIVVKNDGTGTARNVKASLVRLPGMEEAKIIPETGKIDQSGAWVLDKLEPGGKAQATISLKAPRGVSLVEGSLEVTGGPQATVTGFKVGLTLPEPIPQVKVEKTWVGYQDGKDLWDVTITNTGKQDAAEVVVVDSVKGATWGNLPEDATVDEDNRLVIPVIPKGGVVKAMVATENAESNQAWATSQGADRPTPPEDCGKQGACNTATRPKPIPDKVKVTKKHVDVTDSGQDRWLVTVKNDGKQPVNRVTVSDSAPGAQWATPPAGEILNNQWVIPSLPAGKTLQVMVSTQGVDENMAWASTGPGRDITSKEQCKEACGTAVKPKPEPKPEPEKPSKPGLDQIRVEKTHQDSEGDTDRWLISVVNMGEGKTSKLTIVDSVKNARWGTPTLGRIAGGKWLLDGLDVNQVASVTVTTKNVESNLAWVEDDKQRRITGEADCAEACAAAVKPKPEPKPTETVLDRVKVEKTHQGTVNNTDRWRITITNTGDKPAENLSVVDSVSDAQWDKPSVGRIAGGKWLLPKLGKGERVDVVVTTKGADSNLAWVENGKQRKITSESDCTEACAAASKPKPTPTPTPTPTPSETRKPEDTSDPWDKITLEASSVESTNEGRDLVWQLTVRSQASQPVENLTVRAVLPLERVVLEQSGGNLTQSGSKSITIRETPVGGAQTRLGAGIATSGSSGVVDMGGATSDSKPANVSKIPVSTVEGHAQTTLGRLEPGGSVSLRVSGRRTDNNPVEGTAQISRAGTADTGCVVGKCVRLSAAGVTQKPDNPPSVSPAPTQPPTQTPSGSGGQPSLPAQPAGAGGVPNMPPGGFGGGIAQTGSLAETLTPWAVFIVLSGLLLLVKARGRKHNRKTVPTQ